MTDKLPELARPKPPEADSRIRGKLKSALDLMVYGGEDGIPLDYAAAARSLDYPVRSMRRALERPHVRAYLREAAGIMRASVCARIPHRLGQLMLQDDNRAAAVRAAATLEAIDVREIEKPPTGRQVPGLQIVILQAPPTAHAAEPPLINIAPNSPSEDDRH
jgi:hypothetical protein